jgi:hypothetical protein
MVEYETQPDDDTLVDAKDAAAILNTPIKTIYSWCSETRPKGQGPAFIRINRSLKFRMGDLRQFVANNYHVPRNGAER